MTWKTALRGGIGPIAVVVLSLAGAHPSAADKWPGKSPVPGGAVATKAIAKVCAGVLQAQEVDEVQAYLDRYLGTLALRDPNMSNRFRSKVLPELETVYLEDHRKPDGCGEAATELARDMLERIRAVASDASYWEQVLHPRVAAIDATYAKAVGIVCTGTLGTAEIRDLDAFVKDEMAKFAATSSPADTATTWTYLRDSEKKFTDELRSGKHCIDLVRKDARDIVSKVASARRAPEK